LLSDDGAIFISIDDNELYNLKMICDEIFGGNCFVADISWQRTYSMRNDSKGIPAEIEHIIVYGKNINWLPDRLPRTQEMNANYKNPDHDVKGAWQNTSAFAPGASSHQGMVYAIQHPFTGEMIYPSSGACWRYQQDQMLKYMQEWCPYEYKDIHDDKERAAVCGMEEKDVRKGIKAIVLAQSVEKSRTIAQAVYDKGNWPRFFFTNKGKGGIRRKTYLENLPGKIVTNFWSFSEVGHTDEAKKELLSVFPGKATFDTPKPSRLIERIVQIATDADATILDSFAGSGTTAHAVLNMNKSDGGNRKFILVEMGDYANDITAERVKRVINGYGEGKNTVEGTGGDFSYYELGKTLFLHDGTLNNNMETEDIRRYIWYTETNGSGYMENNDEEYYLGSHNDTAYYFYFEKDGTTVLDYKFLTGVRVKQQAYIIYADSCALSESDLQRWNITFKKIPRDIEHI
jgi:adenine-specific DNA-methyltransferase